MLSAGLTSHDYIQSLTAVTNFTGFFNLNGLTKVIHCPALRTLPRVVQLLKLLPGVDTTSHFRHPRVDTKPHFNGPRENK